MGDSLETDFNLLDRTEVVFTHLQRNKHLKDAFLIVKQEVYFILSDSIKRRFRKTSYNSRRLAHPFCSDTITFHIVN